ncbi:glycosyltransferase family A protein [Pedobacter zeae]|uniref:Glycosyl transferase n=1 Tax=Pedobacter zeae TaxID=1737356 RepID=A0A7W6K9R0_9SPHI|nr:glycosyltransferase family A protein [Pedobacter zeae]MBB4107805.1 glycosyltransferase involved in cell wall biosynthesis [Pedobacter zeae]GGG96929.1 glycosyl transferase [Pedobacter zeae]
MYFTCIVTCYNRENTIERAIRSILNQSFRNFEIIVVDDASLDQSVQVINSINDKRIKIIKHKKNQGQNAALNTGIGHSKHEIIAFLDSDDVWERDYLEEMALVYMKYPEISFCYCNLVNGPVWNLEGENKYAEVLNQGYLSSMITITAKKKAILAIGQFDLKYTICQDDDFCFRLSQKFSFKIINKPLAKIVGANNSMTFHLSNVAKGWAFLFKNYKNDILQFCGPKTYAKHMLKVATLYFQISKINKGIKYYLVSIIYFLSPRKNFFRFSSAELWDNTINIVKMFYRKFKNKVVKNA